MIEDSGGLVTVGKPQKAEAQNITVVNAYQKEPLVATAAGSCNLNTRSFVITPKNQGESYTQ